jgi:hypothetical protein
MKHARAEERNDGRTHSRKASHLLFPNSSRVYSKKRHRIGIGIHALLFVVLSREVLLGL